MPPLFHLPFSLLPFQQDGVVQAYVQDATIAAWDVGMGKSVLSLVSACLLFEDDKVDVMVLVCEQGKVGEWEADCREFTDLRTLVYRGTAERRRKMAQAVASGEPVKVKRGMVVEAPQVLIGTYETFRNDLMQKVPGKTSSGKPTTVLAPHFLAEALAGKRVMFVYDEATKLGNRGSGVHKAQALAISHVRKTGGQAKVLALTATPIERGPENFYNLGRLMCPERMGTVKSFEDEHVRSWDQFGGYSTFKNLTPETTYEPWVTPLTEKMGQVLLRKRKTDDDVREQFPESTERFIHVPLGDKQRDFYDTVAETYAPADDDPHADRKGQVLVGVLRMIAGHPEALLHSGGQIAREIVSIVGEEGIRAVGSAKEEALAQRLRTICLDQGDQAVVFTFFGPTMIPLLARRLTAEGLVVATNYSSMDDADRKRSLDAFRAGDAQIFLSSDAGARGINLPQASYCIEYESAVTSAVRTQRHGRVDRINSKDLGREHVFFQTFVAKDTIEEGLAKKALKRNEWSDMLLGDEDAGGTFVSAEDRKILLRVSRDRA